MNIQKVNKVLFSMGLLFCIVLIVILLLLSSCSSKKNINVKQEHELEERDKEFEEFYNEHY